ncbi:hypothetical protein EDEG_03161 [Edhazardia aedis USNM 41457]|uniref:Uncharacterized protein n=1 Tax=Edhazardia aedis (strain USNM 41457) TaxID=1003232 RepID=J9D4D8_EDHAE|nr:hypothetical protein EDEG_03161 [Edhazardia aedis USNM 41457]|eukprot:EJW02419.1 hypothetical protein EDEG_03161 [Edhazardia aedis USNM 41457]
MKIGKTISLKNKFMRKLILILALASIKPLGKTKKIKKKLKRNELSDESTLDHTMDSYENILEYQKEQGEASSTDIAADADLVNDLKKHPQELLPKKIEPNKKVPIPKSQEEIDLRKEQLSDATSKINKALGLSNEVGSISDLSIWERLYEYIKSNVEDLTVDGRIGITLHTRYFLCSYIIMFIPGNFVIVIPKILFSLIPTDFLKNNVIGNALREIKLFFDFVKNKSKNQFIIGFTLGLATDFVEDFEFILEIPNKMFSDPMSIIDKFLKFELRSDGFADYKEKYNKKTI